MTKVWTQARRMALYTAWLALTACAAVPKTLAIASCPVAPAQEIALQPAVFDEGPMLSAQDVRADFAYWLKRLNALHPQMDLRTDMAAFARVRAEIEAAIQGPMSQRAAWMLFARLEATLQDGHAGVRMPDATGTRAEQWLAAGHRLFPLDVQVSSTGELRVAAVPEVAAGFDIAVGERIVSINKRPAAEIVAAQLARIGADSRAFQLAYLQRRFPQRYWQVFGDTGNYAFELEDRQGCVRQLLLPGARTLPTAMRAEPPASELFQHEILAGGVGYLRVDSFLGSHGEALATEAARAFADFKEQGVRAVIIDIRENGGGDDPLWQQSLMEYLTDKPYTHVGGFAVRVNEDNADPGDVVGEVQRKLNTKRFTPKPNNPLRFSGPVYLLVGPYTYSSAVQFAVAAQDFAIAKIAGTGTGALSCQTGQVKNIPLPRTGLNAFTPVIAFTRPSGQGCAQALVPDLLVDQDDVDPRQALEQLAREVGLQLVGK